jgi:hypothetical protein
LLEPYVGSIVVALFVVVLLLLLLSILLARRIGRLQERLEGLTRGASGRSIEAILEAHLEKVFQVARELDELSARTAILEGKVARGSSATNASRPDGKDTERAQPDS